MSLRAMFSGVTGLKNHQLRMDQIGNNIANVNTIGYKSSRVTFQEAISQTLSGGSRPSDDSLGTNPQQIGLGSEVASVDTNMTQGNLKNTGNTTDLAIQGDSLFVVNDGTESFFTRNGNFQVDAQGRLTLASNGMIVQGRNATNGTLSQTIGDIEIPLGKQAEAAATGSMDLTGNLDAAASTGDTRETSMTVYDSLGNEHEITLTFTKTANSNEWSFSASTSSGSASVGNMPGTTTVTFGSDGRLQSVAGDNSDGVFSFELQHSGGTATPDTPQSIDVNLGEIGTLDGLSQFSGASSAVFRSQDGNTTGKLKGFNIDSNGMITGQFTNSTTETLGQIALADFANPGGLRREGESLFDVSANSGAAQVGFADGNASSKISAGTLELSNVDLSEQFTNMISTQRGFQANSRVVTTADEMLRELVNLKQ